jgi:hypothetical protein
LGCPTEGFCQRRKVVVVTEVVDVVSHFHILASGGGRRYTTFRYRKLKTEGDAKVGGTVSPVNVEDVDTDDEMSRRISCGSAWNSPIVACLWGVAREMP